MNQNQYPHGPSDEQWSGGQEPQSGGDWQQPRRPRGRGQKQVNPQAAAFASVEERAQFIRRTYTHLMGAIFGCVAMMALFMNSPAYEPVMTMMVSVNWLWILGLFIAFSWMGDIMAHRVDSKGLQYIGLLVGVGAFAIILTLPVSMAAHPHYGGGPEVLVQALLLTGITFAALTAVVFKTGQDFRILRTGLIVMSVLAFGAIAAGALFGFTLGLGFSVIMIGFSSAMIVYQTSEILHHYRTDQHVGAALGLFSSIGMLFWYILSIFMFD